ncbi:MAG TPA: helix-turn-helix domain-containing protein [Chryseobacterium sp.]
MIYTTLLNIAVFQGAILGFVILKSSLFNSKSNKYLAFLLFALSIVLLNHVFEIEGVFASYPLLLFIDNIDWVFLLPVFTFLFIINRINDDVKNKQKVYLYYIPFVYNSILNTVICLDTVAGIYEIPESYMPLINILQILQFLLAIIIILFLPFYSYFMVKHLKNIEEKKWVVTLLTMMYMLLLVWFTTYLVGSFFQTDTSSVMSAVAIFATFFIHWTAYIGVYKYRLAKNKNAVYNFLKSDFSVLSGGLQIVESNIPQEYKESITADNSYFQKLEFLCKENHIYTDSTLNREKVAEKLGISAGYLSQIVNTITEDNFANYINQYRVEAVKEMISDPEFENYTLLTMGLEAGFTSKTTFYNSFKKVTGQTPNEYKNSSK